MGHQLAPLLLLVLLLLHRTSATAWYASGSYKTRLAMILVLVGLPVARTTQILRLELPSLARGLQAFNEALPSCMLSHNC
jgi:hypothetical protein